MPKTFKKVDYTVEAVEEHSSKTAWAIRLNIGGIILSKEYRIVPLVGDTITLYETSGANFCGLDLNGKRVFYHK